jgi:hypothetical protein
MTEVERLKRQLAEAKAENDRLRLQLDNVTLLYRQMMIEAGKPLRPSRGSGGPISN